MSKIEGINRYSFRNINWEEYSSESENEEKERKIKEKSLISKYSNQANNCLKKEEISKIIRKNNYDESKIEKEIKIKLKEKSNIDVNSEWMEVRKGKIKPYKSSKNVSNSNYMNSNDYNPSKNNEKKSLNNLLNIKHNDNFDQNKNAFKTLYRPQKRKELNNFNGLIPGKINTNKDYDSDNDNKNHYFNIWKKSVINSDDENDNKGNNSIEETNINSKNDERDDKDFENTDKEIERINFEDDTNKNEKKVEKEKTFFKIWLHNTSSNNNHNQKQYKERNFFEQILYKEKGKLFINNLKKISKYKKNIYNNKKKKESNFNCCDFTISKENDLFFGSYYDTIYRENLIRQKTISKDSKNTQIMYIIQPFQIPSDMNVCIVQPNQAFNYPLQEGIKNNSKNTNDSNNKNKDDV